MALLGDGIISYVENPKCSTTKIVGTNKFSKDAGYKINKISGTQTMKSLKRE